VTQNARETVDRDDDVISLQDYLAVLRRQRWIVLATVVVVVVAALAVSLTQTPVYEAETEVVVEPVRRTQDVTLEELLLPQNDVVQTERLVVTSRPVAERVAASLGLPDARTALDDVRVETVADTRVVRIVAANTDPAAAVSVADAFATAYLDYRRDDAVEGLLAARANLESRAADLRATIADLDEDDDSDVAERDALLAQLAQIAAQLGELGESTGTVTGGGSVLTPAELPGSPVSPQPVRTGALAVVLGLLLGVGLAFLRDHIDDVVRDESDFKRATGGKPILGRIPSWNDPDGGDRLATVIEPTSLASESYRELSSGVRFLLAAAGAGAATPDHAADGPGTASEDGSPVRNGRSIVMVSAAAGDGKTSTACNLAVAAARTGLTTLLVDADLRRSSVAKRFGLGRSAGLSDVLAGNGDVADHVVPVGIDGLYVLPAGTLPPNPHELLASGAMRSFEQRARATVDLVIYDTPAVLAVPDALEIGRHADVAILVGRAEVSSRRQLSAALERLQQVGTDIAGTVLNDLSGRADAYYYAYYYADSGERADGGQPAVSTPAKAGGRRERRAAKRAAKRLERRNARRSGAPSEPVSRSQGPDTDRIPAVGVRSDQQAARDAEELFGANRD
jgi:capsular exopolysaccharide synthesis family protein